MTNIFAMTNIELQAAMVEAAEWSDWYFDEQDFHLAGYWNGRAEELLSVIKSRAAIEHAARAP